MTAISVYATPTDLQQAGLPAKALTGVSTTIQQNALAKASSMMDDYFRSQFTLPFTAISYSLTQRCCDIAALIIMKFKGFDPEDPADKAIKDGYEDAIKWCEGVRDRIISPGCVDSATPANRNASPAARPIISSWDALL
jgi:phage gp36-like protein